ncbi:MAG: Stp1/IreP family PP2C-type Ser/Thr phosphatase [Christensenellaceae bacterium]
MKTVAISHVGKVRKTNEDSVLVQCDAQPYYMLVADGMGGHAAGEIASKIACFSVKKYIDDLEAKELNEDQVLKAVEYANLQIVEETDRNKKLKGMGTTVTFAAFNDDNIVIAQVGDSSAYHFDGKNIKKITKDHTYVQHLIDSGVIKKTAAGDYPFKNIITRALGMKELVIDIYNETWKKNDIILLCSDGLSNYTDDSTLIRILSADESINKKAQLLIDFALDGGGKDNISVILASNYPMGDAK